MCTESGVAKTGKGGSGDGVYQVVGEGIVVTAGRKLGKESVEGF